MPDVKKVAQRLRELMPEGFTRILVSRTGCYQRQTMSDLVLSENPRAKYWPYALGLAQETDPDGYAHWAAANPDKVAGITPLCPRPALAD